MLAGPGGSWEGPTWRPAGPSWRDRAEQPGVPPCRQSSFFRLGYFFSTAARTCFFSASDPCWATRANAFRACSISGIGYFSSSGRANDDFFSFLRLALSLRSFDTAVSFRAGLVLPHRGADESRGVTRGAGLR